MRVSPRVILGIDPGFGRMGFGCLSVEKNSLRLLGVGVMTTPVGDEFASRLLSLSQDIRALIEKYHPTTVAIEKLFFAKNTTTAMRVAEARGVVLCEVARAGVRVVEFAPAQIKNALTGDGKADKRAIQVMVKTLLGLPRVPRPDDAADALAIAITASTL